MSNSRSTRKQNAKNSNRKSSSNTKRMGNTYSPKREVPEDNPTSLNGVKPIENTTSGEPKQTIIYSILRVLLKIIEVLAMLGTVAAAFLAWRTLVEMQTERINAYRPEIVITPNTFNGELFDANELESNKKYMYIDYNTSDPRNSYWRNVYDNKQLLCLEVPYLTLKNIGHGTAKNICVKFSNGWIEEAVEELNKYSDDQYIYSCELEDNNDTIYVYFSDADKSEKYILAHEHKIVSNITYISSDEGSVNIELPEGWYRMLAVMYNRFFQHVDFVKPNSVSGEIKIPDLNISIEFSDIQGKTYKQEMTIPWTGYCQYINNRQSSDC